MVKFSVYLNRRVFIIMIEFTVLSIISRRDRSLKSTFTGSTLFPLIQLFLDSSTISQTGKTEFWNIFKSLSRARKR